MYRVPSHADGLMKVNQEMMTYETEQKEENTQTYSCTDKYPQAFRLDRIALFRNKVERLQNLKAATVAASKL